MKKIRHEDRKSFAKWGLPGHWAHKSTGRKPKVKRTKPVTDKSNIFPPRSLCTRSKYGPKVGSKARVIWQSGTRVGSF